MSRVHPIFRDALDTIMRTCGPRPPVNPLPLLLRCAVKLEVAAQLTEQGYPDESQQFAWLAKLVRSHLARATEDNR